MRYVVIDVYPRESIDRAISELNTWFRVFAGRESLGVELRVIKRGEVGRVIIQVPNNLLRYLRSAVVMAGRDGGFSVVTVKVTGTMRKAQAIASSVPYLFSEFYM